jgi:hypothetical protein
LVEFIAVRVKVSAADLGLYARDGFCEMVVRTSGA